MTTKRATAIIAVVIGIMMGGCGQPAVENGTPERFRVPPGASFAEVADTLEARDLIMNARLFRLYARVRGDDRAVHAGTYAIAPGTGWGQILDYLVEGRVLTTRIALPEGWTISQVAGRLGDGLGVSPDSVLAFLTDSAQVAARGLPGPTFEGYLYPATYLVPVDADPVKVIDLMVGRYQQIWTPERRALADSIGMSEREVVTLASIVEREARVWTERDTIAGVFHNRLEIGMPLQADPTVQYALGTHQQRLFFRHIEEVADNPYNTYTHRGLPPGPIAMPSTGAIDATLRPAQVDYLYFVAHPDGHHVFARTNAEHNRNRVRMRQEIERRRD